MDKIGSSQKLTDNPDGSLQEISYLAAVLPSIHLGFHSGHDSRALSGNDTVGQVDILRCPDLCRTGYPMPNRCPLLP